MCLIMLNYLLITLGAHIERLTDVKPEDPGTARSVSEKTAMVRAARQLLSAITKVLILADRVVVKQVLLAKDKVGKIICQGGVSSVFSCHICIALE